MRVVVRVWPAVMIALVALTPACGGEEPASVSVPDATSSDGELDDGLSFSGLDAARSFDVAAPEVPDVGLVDGGGPFPCGACFCDGRTHYCDVTSGGPPGPPESFPDDAGPCPDAGSRCKPLPPGCVPARCACLLSVGWCWCGHSDKGDGLLAGCFYP